LSPNVSSVQYKPWSAIQQFSLGNGLTETHGYNDRLQPTSISAGSWAINLYPCPGQAVHCSANNGNILEQDVTTPGVSGLKQTFGYDALNRLTAATEQNSGGPVTWTQSYSYDTYGNRWVSANSGVSLSPFTAVANSNFDAANHLYINGAGYDNTGNQTAIGGFANTFDAESRLTASTLNATTATYAYDGEGRRVQRIAGGATTQYVYDSQGNLVAEYSTQVPAVTGTEYLIADHLGSTRMTTDASGACLALHDYLPFGEEIPSGTGGRTGCYGSSDAVRQQFTGKERDSETGLDYFGARYFSGAQGRYTSPDPLMASATPSNPQTWNRYAYGLNNPLRYIDPDGMKEISVADCQKDSNCTVVAMNVILDKNANNGQGLTKDQVAQFGKVLQGAKDDLGNGNIALDVSYTSGEVTSSGVSGLSSSAANLFLSSYVPTSVTGNSMLSGSLNGATVPDPSTKADVMFISANNAQTGLIGSGIPFVASFTNTITHEILHSLSGDTSRRDDNPITRGWNEFKIDRQASGLHLDINYIRPEQLQRAKMYSPPAHPDALKPGR
jgi:RHS repeat-associated protein